MVVQWLRLCASKAAGIGSIPDLGKEFISAFNALPAFIDEIVATDSKIERIADKYYKSQNFMFMGRGINYPVAMEGALKLKEISYIHAEGFGAGELKHGPIALINEQTPSLFLVPDDALRDKNISNMKEVKARGGKIIAVCTQGDDEVKAIADDVIEVPKIMQCFYPFLLVVPLQLFAYHCAVKLGRDVDQPRNLAKSVTVE